MTGKDAFILSYIPWELNTLKSWLLTSSIVSLLLICVDLLRDDSLSALLSLIATIAMFSVGLILPTISVRRRGACMVFSGVALCAAVIELLNMKFSILYWWKMSWIVIPSCLTVFWLSSNRVSRWVNDAICAKEAENGLARNSIGKKWSSIIGTHTILFHAVLIVLIPIIWIFDVAISPGNALGGKIGDSFTIDHFSKILSGDSFWLWLRNSMIVSIGTTFFGLAIAIPAAYSFSRWRFRGRNQAMFSFLLVQMFPGVIILVPYFLVMKSLGLLNSNLGLILAYSVTVLPLCVWMLKGFFDTIPRELEEAALLDGCNQVQVFTKVVLPLSMPAVAVTALFSFLAAWNEFLLALTFNTSNDMYTLPVGLASMISSTNQAWGDFDAASLLVSLPVVILFIIFQRFLIQGLSAGGVKG